MQRLRDLNRHMAGPDEKAAAHMEDAGMSQKFSLNVNGKVHTVDADPDMPLLYALRDDLGLNNPHFGCGLAQCGACTVHLDGKPTRSCVTPLADVGNAKIVTLAGLGTAEKPHPLQAAYVEEQVPQCAYCIEVHRQEALKAGVTEQELAEAIHVTAALRAGGAITHGTHLLES